MKYLRHIVSTVQILPLLLTIGYLIPGTLALGQDSPTPLSSFLALPGGFRVLSASVSTGAQSGLGQSGRLYESTDPTDLTTTLSGMATVGWGRSAGRSHISITYSPLYLKTWQQSGFSTLGHSLTVALNQRLAPRWSVAGGLSASYVSMDQVLFSAPLISTAASIPASLDDLANSLLTSSFSTEHLAAALSGSSIIDSPSRVLFGRDRLFTSEAHTSLTYALTAGSRTSLTVSAGGIHTQSFSTDQPGGSRDHVPALTTGTVGVTVAHWLTPRTSIGTSADASRTESAFYGTYTVSTTGFIGRKMGRQWFAQVSAGPGLVRAIRQVYPSPHSVQFTGGASIGYKPQSHTILLSANRSLIDTYGLGSTSTDTASVAWTWSPGRRTWSTSASASAQQMKTSLLGVVTSWQVNTGIVKRLRSDLSASLSYVYNSSGYVLPLGRPFTQQGVRATLTWTSVARR